MRKYLYFVFVLFSLIGVLGFTACSEDSPYPENMWTMNIYPGTHNVYNIGDLTHSYHEGWFTELYLNGHLFTGRVPTTLVVSANDSLDRYRADFVCDGVQDDVEIQAAINALPAGGGRVVLLEGTYNSTANINLTANMTVEGQGYSTIIVADDTDITNVFAITGSLSAIKNLSVVVAPDCGIVGARPNGVYAVNISGLILESLWLYGDDTPDQEILSQQEGIYFENADYSKILNCKIEHWKRNGIYIRNGSDYNNISNNSCYENTDDGIYVSQSYQNIVDSNGCDTNGRHGMLIYNALYTNVSNNICDYNDCYGIDLYNYSQKNTVVGNTCSNNDWSGIRLSDNSASNIITGNTCRDTVDLGLPGIFLDDDCDYNVITGNNSSGNDGEGMRIYQSSYCTIVGNVCFDNGDDGIRVEGNVIGNADYNTVDGNVCYSNVGDGVEIEGDASGGNTYAIKNIVTSNQLTGNGASLNDDGTNTQTDNNII